MSASALLQKVPIPIKIGDDPTAARKRIMKYLRPAYPDEAAKLTIRERAVPIPNLYPLTACPEGEDVMKHLNLESKKGAFNTSVLKSRESALAILTFLSSSVSPEIAVILKTNDLWASAQKSFSIDDGFAAIESILETRSKRSKNGRNRGGGKESCVAKK
jgi:hypothetical protein